MMSKKCKYAIKALIYLARQQGKGNVFTANIATEENIPKKFLEQILLVLKRAGYVGSQTGYGGGYFLLKPADTISVADIHRLFDGAIALVPCVAFDYYQQCADCNDEVTCTMRREFMKIKEQTRQVMKMTSIESFLQD